MKVLIKVCGSIMLIIQAVILQYDASGISKHYLFSKDADMVLDIILIVFWAYVVFGNVNNNKVNYD